MSFVSMRLAFAAAFALVPAPLHAQPAAAASELAASPHAPSVLDVPIKDIAASRAGCAILDKNFPEMRRHGMYDFFKSMSLNQVAAMSDGKITPAMLAQARADLSGLPVMASHQPVLPPVLDDPAPPGSPHNP